MFSRVVASLAAAGILACCSTLPAMDPVASVNDATLSDDLLNDLVTIVGNEAISPDGAGINADTIRNIIEQWIRVEIIIEHLNRFNVEVTDKDRKEAVASLNAGLKLADLNDAAHEYLSDAQASVLVFNRLPDPQASFEAELATADIFVKARYGFFDPEFGVLPIGVKTDPSAS